METRQNEGEGQGAPLPVAPEGDSLEEVLDAWSTEPSSRQRFERMRLERRDGSSLEVLVDPETARDLGDKLTIIAARLRYRSRGAGQLSEPARSPEDAGAEEDLLRTKKVFDLMGLDIPIIEYRDGPLVAEFRAMREDRARAFDMIDQQSARHTKANEISQKLMAEKIAELEDVRDQLEIVTADRAKLIADIDAADKDLIARVPYVEEHLGCTRPDVCSCDCKTCKRVYFEQGRPRPPVGEQRRWIHEKT